MSSLAEVPLKNMSFILKVPLEGICQAGSEDESVKCGGGKTGDLLCNELWQINTGNRDDDSDTQDIHTAVFMH